MAAPKQRVRRVTVDVLDSTLSTTRRRGIGWGADCDCGWRSRILDSYREARAEGRAHAASIHAELRLTIAGPL